MFSFPMSRRQVDRPATRKPLLARRPLVEDLEGRQALSGLAVTGVDAIVGNHIGVVASEVQGAHIGMVAGAIQGAHIGVVEAEGGGGVGRHIG